MKSVSSIIQVTVIKPKEQDTRGNTGHRREGEGLKHEERSSDNYIQVSICHKS